ncbi:hypothetical protein PS723_05710 [Pseudomonas fluorescens]|uniref:Uncharacterized protein n=1 Tax=Pseudomonas fluorescens TaxID=294 RepID=A0A5E7FNB5_PSEFL|nr:hypothetical protein [Pseudomonas fluorescens]VVO39717.1 hypothetical protein PS723_05710 [Pseudomonas fluorescens]
MNLERSDGVVTLLVRHRVKQGKDEQYERVQSIVLITLSIVLLLVYVFMPRVTRLFSKQLQPGAGS